MLAQHLRAQRGFTLIEALVALLVLAFGMLGIAGFQLHLSRGSDVAKQRTEATRLAQQKMEQLRSFEQLASAAGKFAYADLAGGNDTPVTTTNTTFARSWTVSGVAADLQRTVSVMVTWTDRANDLTSVTLVSVISKSDPADAGGLGVPLIENGILRRPIARGINNPTPAIQLGGANQGKSTAEWPGGGWLVFNNVTGDAIALCATQPNDTTDLTTCTPGNLLVGFINDGNLNGTAAFPWALTDVTLTDTADVIGTPDCFVAPARDPNNGNLLPDFLFYACLIQPNDHDSNPATPRRWTGKLAVVPAPTGTQTVCRFNGNFDNPGTGVHENVTESLDNQNYLLIGSGGCPAGTSILP